MSDDSADLHVKVRHRSRPPSPYKWEIYRGTDPIPIKRAMYGYPTEQAGKPYAASLRLRPLNRDKG
jgi:hypothetical protein